MELHRRLQTFLLLVFVLISLFFQVLYTRRVAVTAVEPATDDEIQTERSLFPIFPNNVLDKSPPMKHFFDTYPSKDNLFGGWIDVNKLSIESISDLRNISKGISGSESLHCGYPKVQDDLPPSSRDNNTGLEYCFWNNDVVSNAALKNFSFEEKEWKWVVRAFSLAQQRLKTLNEEANNTSHCTQQLGFLDVGINVGDWISPIRLLAPEVPIFGIEGSPATAAIATANLRTSIEHNSQMNKPNAPSMVLPFSLIPISQRYNIFQQGGVCFAKVRYFGGEVNAFNVGGRSVTKSSDCPPSDAAGATTLLHAIKSLAHYHHPSTCPSSSAFDISWPRVFLMKIDVEGHEFKALSSVVPWLHDKPPCYISLEYSVGPTSTSVLELLVDAGYDAAWRPRENEFPMESDPYWDGKNHQESLHKKIGAYIKRDYTELIIGFLDLDSCIANLQLEH